MYVKKALQSLFKSILKYVNLRKQKFDILSKNYLKYAHIHIFDGLT